MYESGCAVAFLLWLYRMVMLLATLNSMAEKNLRKVGMRHSWYSGRIVRIEAPGDHKNVLWATTKFTLIQILGLVGVFFSWLSVAWFVGAMLYAKMKDAGAPVDVKEFRWKLRNLDLQFDDILIGLAKISGVNAPIEVLREDMLNSMRDRGFQIPRGVPQAN